MLYEWREFDLKVFVFREGEKLISFSLSDFLIFFVALSIEIVVYAKISAEYFAVGVEVGRVFFF
ncbi:hypothetical protein UCMB321_4659 [Pseudomonas batumici]|uniref:Uncharacterized protein n=1 Tax=Pseudomonas batumici TaxID=226910 RepID=A0A0C2I8J3_9PSED|nr:hypothetical protein UCMB321_4659 [Pseudomonas batumici]